MPHDAARALAPLASGPASKPLLQPQHQALTSSSFFFSVDASVLAAFMRCSMVLTSRSSSRMVSRRVLPAAGGGGQEGGLVCVRVRVRGMGRLQHAGQAVGMAERMAMAEPLPTLPSGRLGTPARPAHSRCVRSASSCLVSWLTVLCTQKRAGGGQSKAPR